jgi:hypothetical protein
VRFGTQFAVAMISPILLMSAVASPARAEPVFCEAIAYGSVWESYLASPPPPIGISQHQAELKSQQYQSAAARLIARDGYVRLARQYLQANGLSAASFSQALKAVSRSSRSIEQLCGFRPYDYGVWRSSNPVPPPDRTF